MVCITSLSILLVAMGVSGVAQARRLDRDASSRPMATSSQERRICASLCKSGMGGDACGASCPDAFPQEFRVQSGSNVSTPATRRDACPVLCANLLGKPLCQCDGQQEKRKPDFKEVCSYFCLNYNKQIDGCQDCSAYESENVATTQKIETKETRDSDDDDEDDDDDDNGEVDWDVWCQQMCAEGDGGLACNCDILPLSAQA